MITPLTCDVQAAIYARVSSDSGQKQTIDSQVEALRERVSGDGLPLSDDNCFLDDGISGSTLHRPALERLRDAAYVRLSETVCSLTGSVGTQVRVPSAIGRRAAKAWHRDCVSESCHWCKSGRRPAVANAKDVRRVRTREDCGT